MKILSFGEVLWDVYPDNKYIGGAPLNFAAHSAKLGADCYLLSAVGDDELAKDTLKAVKGFNINTDYVETVNGKQTGKCLVTLDKKSVPSYNLLNDVAWDYISFNGKKENFDALYFGTLALRSVHNRETLTTLLQNYRFNEVFVDVNIRPPFYSDYVIDFAFKSATILKISDEELETTLKAVNIDFTDDLATVSRYITEKYSNIKILIITCGADGSVAFDTVNKSFYTAPPVKANVISTVGAGDSFSAAFLSKFFNGESIEASLEFASKVAGFVVSHYEAVPEYKLSDFG